MSGILIFFIIIFVLLYVIGHTWGIRVTPSITNFL